VSEQFRNAYAGWAGCENSLRGSILGFGFWDGWRFYRYPEHSRYMTGALGERDRS
jgi:hypothetical protein